MTDTRVRFTPEQIEQIRNGKTVRDARPTDEPDRAPEDTREQIESRVFQAEVREVETTESLSMMRGLAVPYGEWANIGWFMEQFAPGSLGKSVNRGADRRLRRGHGLVLNLFHEGRTFPIGVSTEWDEQQEGLFGVWRLDDSDEAQRGARLARDGMLTGMSIEFQPEISRWAEAPDWNPDLGPDHLDQCTRVQARLGAVALVQTPAYEGARVDLVRSNEAAKRMRKGGTPVLDEMRRRTAELRGGTR